MRGERARELFMAGYNCPQAVMLAYADAIGLPEEKIAVLALPMGAGMGRLRGTCGALTGAVLCLGLLFPEKGKAEVYALVQRLAAMFEETCGGTSCSVLLKKAGIEPSTSPTPEPRTEEFYARRPCPALVFAAADCLERLIQEQR